MHTHVEYNTHTGSLAHQHTVYGSNVSWLSQCLDGVYYVSCNTTAFTDGSENMEFAESV